MISHCWHRLETPVCQPVALTRSKSEAWPVGDDEALSRLHLAWPQMLCLLELTQHGSEADLTLPFGNSSPSNLAHTRLDACKG